MSQERRGAALSQLLLPGLAMSVGWGFRGDYGHEAGAMIPGALVALAICLTSHRADWHRRYLLMATLGAIGWAFGGQMSYGILIGYTAHNTFLNVAYGFASLFVVGALWGGVGAGMLALSVTQPRSEIERYTAPVLTIGATWTLLDYSGVSDWLSSRWSLYDTDWVSAVSATLVAGLFYWFSPLRYRPACRLLLQLAVGWLLGLGVLTLALGLRMTPPRSDNWAGCVGLFVAWALYLRQTQNRAALLMTLYGLLAGGFGFALGDFVNMLGRAQWGFIGTSETLSRLDSWKWMEQGFGFAMGLGVAMGFRRLHRNGLEPPQEEEPNGSLRFVAPFALLVVFFWINVQKNLETWAKAKTIEAGLFGIAPERWFLLLGLLLAGVVAVGIRQERRGGLALAPASAFGRAQLLFLLMLWIAVLAAFMQALPNMKSAGTLYVHLTFWITASVCSLLTLVLPAGDAAATATVPAAGRWMPSAGHLLLWALTPALLPLLAWLSLSTHTEPLPGSKRRFELAQPSSDAPK